MLARMGSDEFTEWMAFDRLEPFGSLVDDFRTGTIAAQIWNASRQSKDDPWYGPADFAPAYQAMKARFEQPVQDNLTDDEHSALIDAEMFGVVAPAKEQH